MLSLHILGPLVLRRDGVALSLPVKKTQALLVWLALEGVAPRQRLCDLLWPALDEPTARRNLRRELARLREGGAGDALASEGDRLQLRSSVALDLRAVEQALAEGHPEAALAIFGGRVADGLQLDDAPAFNERMDAARQRWHAVWRSTHEACVAAARSGGDGARAMQHLQLLLDDEPLQEQHHVDLMALLAQAGRRADALAQFDRCRLLLDRELGLKPLAATLALAATLRQQNRPVAPSLPLPSPSSLPEIAAAAPASSRFHAVTTGAAAAAPTTATVQLPEQLPFVGRKAEVARLQQAWDAGGTLLLQGEGGVGKTRLALDFASAHGPVALVRCRPGDRGVPYAVFKRALRAMAGESMEHIAWPEWVRHELARLLPALGPAPRALAGAEDRARFLDACAEAWQMLAAGSFDAVLIDNWHHADAPSHALLAYTAQRRHDAEPAREPVREVITWREQELDDSGRAALQALAALPHACRVDLGALAAEELLDLVRQLSGAADPRRFTARLMQATQGHPFFVAETLRHLVDSGSVQVHADGHWRTPFDGETQDYRELSVPATVHDGVLARVQALPEPAQRLLEAASQAGEPFDPVLLAAACALSELQAATAVEQALSARLVRELQPGRWGFAHDLVQQAINDRLGPERRRLVHRRLALGAEQAGTEAAVVARHFEAGGEPQRAVAWRQLAAERALQLGAAADAREHWEAALRNGPTPGQAVRSHEGLLRVALERADMPAAEQAILRLQGLVDGGELAADDAVLARVVLAGDRTRLAPGDSGLARIDALLKTLAPGHRLRARALMARSNALSDAGRLDEAELAADEALAANPDPVLRADMMDTLILIAFRRGQPQQALDRARQALDLAAAQADRRVVARCHGRIGVLLYTLGRSDEGEVEMRRGLAMTAELRLIENQREISYNLAKALIDRGDLAAALALVQQAWNLSPTFTRPEIKLRLMDTLYGASWLRGDLGAALELAQRLLAESASLGGVRPLLMGLNMVLDLYVLLDDFDGAALLLQQVHGRSVAELGHIGVKLNFKRALLGCRAGDLQAARQALAAVGDAAALQQPQDQAMLAVRMADIAACEGRHGDVGQALKPWCGRWPNDELAAAGLALLLKSEDSPAHEAEARAALDSGRLPPLPTLDLHAALAARDPSRHGLLQAQVQRLHASLAAHPQAAARFARRWLGVEPHRPAPASVPPPQA